MNGYKIALIAAIALLLGLTAGFAVGVIKWIDSRKITTAILAGGSAFVVVGTATVTVATQMAGDV